MPDDIPNLLQQLADDLLARHNGDACDALTDLARLYLVARHGWCAGFDRAPPRERGSSDFTVHSSPPQQRRFFLVDG
jgi:hypothetical protein